MSQEKPRRRVNDNYSFLYVNTRESIVPVKPWCVSVVAITAVLYTITVRFKYRFSTVFKLTGTEVYLFSYKLHFPFFIQFFLYPPWIASPTTCCFFSVCGVKESNTEMRSRMSELRGKTNTIITLRARQNNFDYTVHSATLISEPSWRGDEGHGGRKTASSFVSSHFLRKTKKKTQKTTSDSQSGKVPTINCWLIALCKRCSKSEGKEIRV